MYAQHLESQRYYSYDTELIYLWVQRKAPQIQHSCWLAANEFRLFTRKPLAQVTPADIRAFAVGLKARKLPSQSCKQRLSAVKSLLSYGSKMGMLPKFPWQGGVTRQQKLRSLAAKFLDSPVRFGFSWTLCVGLFFGLGLIAPRLLNQVAIASSFLIERSREPLMSVHSSTPRQEVAIANSSKKKTYPLHLVRSKAFLDTIAVAEGTDSPNGYRTQYTGTKFSSFRDHPREVKCGRRYGKMLCSDAAGRYQFLSPTWDRFVKKIRIKNFTPANQDRAALELIREKGALEDIEAGRFEIAVSKVARVWPSLRRFGNGSLEKSMPRLKQVYQQKLLSTETKERSH
ncbi:MAG TPA: glycoside hydrolase family 104 protein [Kamptonema sp.]|nr:glycoside hydrolase family 104 protein [Kamptonema sp.]